MSAEATVSRNYLDWLIAVPWHKKAARARDLKRAEEILHEDHYGLEKIKERILESRGSGSGEEAEGDHPHLLRTSRSRQDLARKSIAAP